MPTLLVITSDEHVNCRAGLCPGPVAQDDTGGTYEPSATQRATWAAWKRFWQDAGAAAEAAACDAIWWVNVGDAVDLNRHDGLAPITLHRARIVDMLERAYAQPVSLSALRWIVKGTEAHVGPHCELEEILGRLVEAEVCPETGAPAWYHLRLECEGVLFDFSHHPKTSGSLPWTRQAAAAREAYYIASEYWTRGERVPDVAVRGHVHYLADSGQAHQPRVLYLPGWQALTPYAYRRGWLTPSEVGGMWIVCRDGTYEEAIWLRRPRMSQVWRAR